VTKRIALVGPKAAELEGTVVGGGFVAECFDEAGLAPADLAGFDLFLISPFQGPGQPLYDRFRSLLGARRAAIVLVLDPSSEVLPESFFAGINDVVYWPGDARTLLGTVRRQVSIARRRSASSIARVRRAASPPSSAVLGSAVNVSRTGVLVEAPGDFRVGDELEIEFFLGDDTDPVRAGAVVRRMAVETSRQAPSYGVEFVRLDDRDRARVTKFCEAS
jgi:hypothetical protein